LSAKITYFSLRLQKELYGANVQKGYYYFGGK